MVVHMQLMDVPVLVQMVLILLEECPVARPVMLAYTVRLDLLLVALLVLVVMEYTLHQLNAQLHVLEASILQEVLAFALLLNQCPEGSYSLGGASNCTICVDGYNSGSGATACFYFPSSQPSSQPSSKPSSQPSVRPSAPTRNPSVLPTVVPTFHPTFPTIIPTTSPTVFENSLYPTGISGGIFDNFWYITNVPSGSSLSPGPAFIMESIPGVYITDYPYAKWIGPQFYGSESVPEGFYTYQTVFSLPRLHGSGCVHISSEVSTDNCLTSVVLNGVTIFSDSTVNCDYSLASLNVLDVVGNAYNTTNVLQFVVYNAPGSGGNPSALLVQFINVQVVSCPPSPIPSLKPTQKPTSPTNVPTFLPSFSPSNRPTSPTYLPSKEPTEEPSIQPSLVPTSPTAIPSIVPSLVPTSNPSISPTSPTINPSFEPSIEPTVEPSDLPSVVPSISPTEPTLNPSVEPTQPTVTPSAEPTYYTTNLYPTGISGVIFDINWIVTSVPSNEYFFTPSQAYIVTSDYPSWYNANGLANWISDNPNSDSAVGYYTFEATYDLPGDF
ncbi:unnamed protein product, partial [Sphagnum jensenii]